MRLKSQKGAAALEFAIVTPLLLLILFGIIEFSILLFDKAMLTNASREGARAGIVFIAGRSPSVTPTVRTAALDAMDLNIKSVVEKYCKNNLISFGSGSVVAVNTTWGDVDSNGETWNAGDNLEVAVTYKFNFLVFSKLVSLFGGNFDDFFNLTAITEMRLE